MAEKDPSHPALSGWDAEYIWETREEKGAAHFPLTVASPHLLLVETDEALRTLLATLLSQEGYQLQAAGSLAQALALVSAQPFDLVLTDLFANRRRKLFRAIKPFIEQIHPIRLGVMTPCHISTEQAAKLGLAFVLPRPVGTEQLLTEIAICLHRPLTPEQVRQAQLIEDFFAALTQKNSRKTLSLCTDDIKYYPSINCPEPLKTALRDKTALASYIETLRSRYSGFRLEVERIYSRPKGLLVRYRVCWAERTSSWELAGGAFFFQFTGDRIRQIGLQADKN